MSLRLICFAGALAMAACNRVEGRRMGGIAPATGCATSADVGVTTYTADYFYGNGT
jgi:hypothetical protein